MRVRCQKVPAGRQIMRAHLAGHGNGQNIFPAGAWKKNFGFGKRPDPGEVSACLSPAGRKNCAFIMQTQDVSADFLLKFWPWLEANRNRLIAIGAAVLVVLFVLYYVNTSRQEKALAAGQAYTTFQLDQPRTVQSQQVADGYLNIAREYSGTMAGQRAQLQAAITLFDAGKYADAQKQFENFLSAYADSSLVAPAQTGVAASLEAQGKLDQAATHYQTIATSFPNSTAAIDAKFSSGRVLQLQGKLNEALTFYQDVARSPLAGSLASVAQRRAAEIQARISTQKPAVQAVQPSASPAPQSNPKPNTKS
jgi:predicted negative regulator of RcsB-dependent stress response